MFVNREEKLFFVGGKDCLTTVTPFARMAQQTTRTQTQAEAGLVWQNKNAEGWNGGCEGSPKNGMMGVQPSPWFVLS